MGADIASREVGNQTKFQVLFVCHGGENPVTRRSSKEKGQEQFLPNSWL